MSDGPVILFDGDCGLCHAAVRFVIARDPRGRFRFASLHSEAARELLASDPGAPAETVLVIDGPRVLARSDAVLRIARELAFPWPLAGVLRVVPRRWRDAVYDAVARRRARFGRVDRCPVPDRERVERFVARGWR